MHRLGSEDWFSKHVYNPSRTGYPIVSSNPIVESNATIDEYAAGDEMGITDMANFIQE